MLFRPQPRSRRHKTCRARRRASCHRAADSAHGRLRVRGKRPGRVRVAKIAAMVPRVSAEERSLWGTLFGIFDPAWAISPARLWSALSILGAVLLRLGSK